MSSGFRVAAVIPARDGLPDVLDAVASALEQTLGPEQVVLVDDGSRDGTAAAVRARFGDRVTILERSCGSAGAARNAGWRATASRRPLVRYQHRPGGLTRQVESRLGGDVDLFHRLASDASLTPALRRRARRREALAHFKLAMVSLREGRSTEARRRVCRGWMFPERAGQVLLLWLASFLPRPLLEWVRGRGWAKRELAAPMARV